jgi:hypothetical protein
MKINDFMAGVMIGVMVATGFLLLIITNVYDSRYMQGQIDAINGNIKYELVEQYDGSTKWKRIERK